MDNECPKLYAPKPKMRLSSTRLGTPYSKTPTAERTSIIHINSPKIYKNKRNHENILLFNYSMKDLDSEIQRDFDEYSAKSEIFSILKTDHNMTVSNVSVSTTFSRNGILNTNEFFNSDNIIEKYI